MKIEDILLDKARKDHASLIARTSKLEFFKRNATTIAICLQGNFTIAELEEAIEHLRDVQQLNGPNYVQST